MKTQGMLEAGNEGDKLRKLQGPPGGEKGRKLDIIDAQLAY